MSDLDESLLHEIHDSFCELINECEKIARLLMQDKPHTSNQLRAITWLYGAIEKAKGNSKE